MSHGLLLLRKESLCSVPPRGGAMGYELGRTGYVYRIEWVYPVQNNLRRSTIRVF